MPSTKNSVRRPLIAANWKMFKNLAETESFLKTFLPQVPTSIEADVVICPPFTSLELAGQLLKGTTVALGAQNINENKSGAYTGEVAGSMLISVGCRYV